MSTTTIRQTFELDGGVLVDMTSVVLSDAAGAFGVKRRDTGGVVVAAGTAMTRKSQGVYEHVLTDPAAGLTYDYAIRFVYLGETYHLEGSVTGSGATSPTPIPGAAEYDAILVAYRTNADYLTTGDATKARAFQAACLRLLSYPEEMSTDQGKVRLNHAQIRQMAERAEAWLTAATGSPAPAAGGRTEPRVSYADFRRFRG